MLKKILIISIIMVLFAFIFWFFYSDEAGGNREEVTIRDWFPFGRTSEITPPPGSNNPPSGNPDLPGTETPKILPRLRRISESPIAGASVFNRGEDLVIRFVDRATGHIFETTTESGTLQRISNTTLPKIREAVWTGQNSVVLRFLREDGEVIESVNLRLVVPGESENNFFEFTKDLKEGDRGVDVLNLQKTLNRDLDTRVAETGVGSPGKETSFFGPATEEAVKKFQKKYASEILDPQNLEEPSGIVDNLTRQKLNNITGATSEREEILEEDENLYETVLSYLPVDIKDLIYLDDLGKIFYLREDRNGTVGFLGDPNGSSVEQIFDSPAREWTARPAGESILLFSKASRNLPGLVYLLETNGNIKKLMGGVEGLSALINDDLEKIAYSGSKDNRFSLGIFDIENKEFRSLPETTMSEKCVWSKTETNILYCGIPLSLPSFDYPDDWYNGLVSFTDIFKKIDASKEGRTVSLMDEESFPEVFFDAVDLFMDDSEQYLFFTNKKDYSLWSFRLWEEAPVITTDESIELEQEN